MRALISFVVVAVTVVFQLTVVDRITFPGGTAPDLVLLAVAALALASGPLIGTLTGFWAGLALDVAPPGSHFVGEDALVFCLIGYACGLLAETSSGDGAEQGHTALFEIAVTAAAAVCGEALLALLGVMLSDPRVTWDAVKHVLPVAAAYDVVLCPFVLYAAAAVLHLAGARGEGSRAAGWSARPARAAAPGAAQGAIRQVANGNTPRLRLAEHGKSQPGGARAPRTLTKREPQLKLGRTGGGGSAAGGRSGLRAAFATGGLAGAPAKVRFGGRRAEGVLGGSLLGGSGGRDPSGRGLSGRALNGRDPSGRGLSGRGLSGRALNGRSSSGRSSSGRGSSSRGLGGRALNGRGLAGSGLSASRFGRSSLGRSLLGGSIFSRSPSSWGRTATRTPTRNGRASLLGRSGPLTPRFTKSSRATSTPSRPKSPGKGWLRHSTFAPGRSSPSTLGRGRTGRAPWGRGMGRKAFARSTPRLRPGRSRVTGPARLRMPRPKAAKRRWRTGGYR